MLEKTIAARAKRQRNREGEQDGGGAAVSRRALLMGAAVGGLMLGLDRRAQAAIAHERRLTLYNPHTDERFHDVYWHEGRYIPSSLERIDWIMRDFHQERVAAMDPKLLDLLHRIHLRLGTHRPLQILSGYRTKTTNRMLRLEGFAAAVHSLHLDAQAADITVEHVSLRHLRHAALSLKGGGVGTYWHDHFVHVDVGPVRTW